MSHNAVPPPSGQRPTGADWADPQAELMERLRRATVGEYDILAALGAGGMATVYLAHDLALDRRVAIKVMSPAMVYGPGLVDRFRLEARTAAALSHPNIIPIFAVRELDGLLFFVMKLVEGTSLDAIIAEAGQLPIPMVEAILAQAGGALGYAHRHGVVHRDVKPGNILLDEEGWVVVTDFGIAKVVDAGALTMTGAAVGTPTYMSPEQCSGDLITGASDQYSLAVVAFEMLTGRPPFIDQSIPQLMIGHATRPPPSIAAVRPDCPVALRTALERMLAKNPADRFPSMEAAISAAEARPLAPDDDSRETLIALARNSSTRHLIAQVRTPRSPVPKYRGAAGAGSRNGWRSTLLIGGGIAAGVAVTALVALALRGGSGSEVTPAAPAIDAAVDSAALPGTSPVGASRGAVNVPAPPPATPPPAPPPPASVRAAVQDPAPAPVPAPVPAAPRSTAEDRSPARSVTADSVLSRVVPRVAEPAPPARETVRQRTPVVPDSVPKAAPDPEVEIEALVQAYARALEAGRIDVAVRLFPAMPADQRQGLEAFYRDGGSMQTRWRVSEVAVSGSVATLRIEGSNVVRTARTGPSEQRVALRARLERGSAGWRFTALVN